MFSIKGPEKRWYKLISYWSSRSFFSQLHGNFRTAHLKFRAIYEGLAGKHRQDVSAYHTHLISHRHATLIYTHLVKSLGEVAVLQSHLQLRLVAEVVVVQHGGVRLGRHVDEELFRIQHRQLLNVTAEVIVLSVSGGDRSETARERVWNGALFIPSQQLSRGGAKLSEVGRQGNNFPL